MITPQGGITVKIGLVGKPNVGKSTFFSAATLAKVDIANYPFCTIEPNVGVAFVAARLPCPCKDIRERLESEGRLETTRGDDLRQFEIEPMHGEQRRPRRFGCIEHAQIAVTITRLHIGDNDVEVGRQAGPTLKAHSLLPSRSRK